MCGISGIINREGNSVSRAELEAITDIIKHRGPDGYGYYYGDKFGFGHRRLSIIDLSDAGHQPMEYMDRYVITYNGEVYNYIELKDELTQHGYRFNSHTDTEVIMAAYDKWGEACVDRFNGMWGFALYDKQKNIIFCSRDRFGVKPFYYAIINNQFVFGSEVKQFSAANGWEAVLNKSKGYDFIAYGIFNHTNETLFENVYQLRGGHNLVYDLNSHDFNTRCWYNIENKIADLNIGFEEAKKRFEQIFTDAIKLRLRADVKVGSCLSGGLDSSSIVCIANQLLKSQNAHGKQETISSCFNIKKYDEQEFVDEVISQTGVISHKIFPQITDLFNDIDRITWHQDEPFGSTSIFAQWNVFMAARQNSITVMLDGQGADEELAGYHAFYGPFWGGLIARFRFDRLFFELKKMKKMHGYSNKYIFNSIIKALLSDMVLEMIFKSVPRHRWIDAKFRQTQIPRNFRSIRSLSLAQISILNLPMLLHYEDRNSMAFSVESRVPFLDYRLVEFIISMPDDYKIRNAQTKYLLREAMKGIIPQKIINRYDKMGFVTPEEVWMRSNKELFRSELEKTVEISNNFIDKGILDYFDQILDNKKPFDFAIWRAISFGRWLRVFNVKV